MVTLGLEAGVTAGHLLDLSQTASSTRLSGELRSQTGTFHGPITLALVDADGRAVLREAAHWVQADGRWSAPFAIDNLPPHGVALKLLSWQTHRRWSPMLEQLVLPQEGLVLLCHDAEPVHEIKIAVVSAETGSPISGGWSSLALAGCEEPQTSTAGEGMRWGARLRAVRAGTLPTEPLAGVQVSLDGLPAGVTGAQGECVLVRESAPERVELALEGWSYAGGALDAESGRLARYSSWHVLRFSPQEDEQE